MRSRLMVRFGIALLLAPISFDSGGALAQGSDDASNLAQTDENGGQGGAGRKAQTAQVGAGTTNGSTTGYSGPADITQNSPGTMELPPLPNPAQCDSYRDTPAYQACLWVVLRD